MKKVKILSSIYEDRVTEAVNEFCAHRNVIDLQFRTGGVSSTRYCVMIVYEE